MTPTITRAFVGTLSLLLLLAVAGAAHAQRTEPAPAPGIRSTWYAPTLRDDVWSINQNPSNVAYSEGLGAVLSLSLDPQAKPADGYQALASYSTRRGPDGFALGIGGGLHVFRSFLGLNSTAFGTTLALAAAFDQISIGLRYRLYAVSDHPEINRFHTGDASLTSRLTRNLGVSLNIENLWTPALAGAPVPRIYSVGTAFRTTRDRAGIDLSYRIPEAGPRASRALRGSLYGVPVAGLRLFAQATLYPYRPEDSFGFSAGLEWTAASVTTGFAAGVAPTGSDPAFFSGSIAYASRPSRGFMPRSATLLRLSLQGELDEMKSSSFLGVIGENTVPFTSILSMLWQVPDSPLEGVYLHLSGIKAGPTQLYELRDALRAIRAAGKDVIVYAERGGLKELTLMAEATWASVPPSFYVIETGIASSPWYFGTLLDRLAIPAQFVETGDYKTGPERFTRSEPSDAARQQRDEYLDAVYDFLVDALSGPERTDVDVRAMLSDSPIIADELLTHGLVDEIAYEDQLTDLLRRDLGKLYEVTDHIEILPRRGETWISPDKIAVIHVNGSIIVGESGRNPLTGAWFTGSKSIDKAVAAVASDPRVRGVIVRIDSPGGSALASDEMHRAFTQLARRKPLVFSMGDVAASGGYYVTAVDARVIASPVTLTGSIGVYAGTIAYQNLIERLGVHRERSERGGPSDFFNGREWSPEDLRTVQAAIDFVYERFLTLVSEARGISIDNARELAGGRVWTGRAALDRGLVDGLGGFGAAYDVVCEQIEQCRDRGMKLVHYPSLGALSLPSIVLARAVGDAESSQIDAVIGRLMDASLPGMIDVLVPFLSEAPGSAMLVSPFVQPVK